MLRHCLNVCGRCRRFWPDKSGATSIEYALIAGGISIVIVAAVAVLGDSVGLTFNNINDQGFGG